jgi:hypothetical protein
MTKLSTLKKTMLSFVCVLCSSGILFAQNPYTSIPLPNGNMMDKRIKTDFKIDNQNNIWITFGTRQYGNTTYTSSIGLAKYNGATWTTWNKNNSALPTNSLTSIAFQGSTVWIGTLNGLVKKNNDTWTVFNTTNSTIATDTIYDISVSGNTIWAATNHGVLSFNGTTWTHYSTATHAIADNNVNTILADKNEKVWIGTNKGISRLANGVWSTLNKSNSGLKTDRINTIEQTADGAIWIGTDTAIINGDVYGGVYTIQNNTVLTAQHYAGLCGSNGFETTIFAIGINGNHPVVPSYFKVNGVGKLKIIELRPNKTQEYQIPFGVGYSIDPMFFTVTSTNRLNWCGANDSIYIGDLDAAVNEDKPNMQYLNINKINTPILNGGDMFWDLENGGYEVPKGSCKRALFSGALWMGGISNTNLRVAAQTYRQNGSDYFPGPLKIGTATTDSFTQRQYDRIWRINRQTIEEFKLKFAEGKVTNGTYTIPENLQSWPAHGDSAKGFAAKLAPFVDTNGDGRYNPLDGDYPKIKGDQMLFWIFNDNANIHSESQGSRLGFEIHASAYGYTCDHIEDNDSNTALNYTTFYQYEIFNRTSDIYDTVRYGIWTDADLGNFRDDYIECNPLKNYAIGYNGDDYDEGLRGYGENPPAIGVAVLDNHTAHNKMSGFMYYNNDFTTIGNPTRPEHYWGYLNQRWKNGALLTYGGNGYNGTDTASFIYPGNNDLASRPLWTEVTAQNEPGDRRMLSNLGANTSMFPGDKHTFEYAIVYSRATSGGAQASVIKLDADIAKIRNWYSNQSFPSCLDLTTGIRPINEITEQKLSVYPNPASQSISLRMPDLTNDAVYHIIDITGRVLLNGKVSSTINIQDLQQGVYFVEVRDGNKQYVSKFIKN